MPTCGRESVVGRANSAARQEPKRIECAADGDGRCAFCDADNGFPTIRGKAPSYYLSDLAGMRMLVLKRRQGDRMAINDTTELIVLEIHFDQVTIAIAPPADRAATSQGVERKLVEEQAQMDADEPVTVYTLNDPFQAEVIKTGLRSKGIFCELDGERQAGLSEILEIGVLVRAEDADRARQIIRRHEIQWAKEHKTPGAE